MSFENITAAELDLRIKNGKEWTLIDVRMPSEYSAVHVNGAVNMPLDGLTAEKVASLRKGTAGTIYVLCQSGGRSRKACQLLTDAGVSVVNVEGGTAACVASGLPVVRGKGVIGIDRQVRIAAGSLVLIGVASGLWLHPAGFGLAAFVGAGLVFAGATDTCGMALMLAMMPWNRSKPTCAT